MKIGDTIYINTEYSRVLTKVKPLLYNTEGARLAKP
jgi:hypothetical protein